MGSPEESKEIKDARREAFKLLCTAMGFALFTWQDVEKAHFKLFLKMLGAPEWEVCSAAYYSTESFEARHKMVGRMAYYFMKSDHYESHRAVWCGAGGGLQKKIKDANENRNKLAHYGLAYDVINTTRNPDGTFKIDLGPSKLQPLDTNLVDRLIGRTPDKPEHNLSHEEVSEYAMYFQDLAEHIKQFQESLTLPPPQQGLDALLAPPIPTGPLSRPPPIPEKSPPTDDPPSES
jgi:hypothetical protein